MAEFRDDGMRTKLLQFAAHHKGDEVWEKALQEIALHPFLLRALIDSAAKETMREICRIAAGKDELLTRDALVARTLLAFCIEPKGAVSWHYLADLAKKEKLPD